MKVVFISSFFNHHQKYLSDAFYDRLSGDYVYIEIMKMREERIKGGWTVYKDVPYICRTYEPGGQDAAEKLLQEADVVIAGSAPEELLRERIRNGKLLFRYSERPLRKGMEIYKYLPRLVKWHMMNPPGKPIYMLCASAYTAGDYRKFGLFKGRCYKWGYFPEVKRYADFVQMQAAKRPASILWAGRLIGWKHPDASILLAEKLKNAGYNFSMKIIGQGELYEDLKTMIQARGLGDCVCLAGQMPQEEVRREMEKSEIFLFTSDKNEGWGAVLNESMNSGCAVVASRAIGSAPYLIQNGVNGMLYESGDQEELFEKVRLLLDCPEKATDLGLQAYRTITEQWNAENAAARFLTLAQCLLEGEKLSKPFAEGVCSPAG